MDYLISVYFLVIAIILLVVLVFLYKLMLAVGRLDRRLEQFARHLRDLNLYDFQPGAAGMFAEATEMESDSGSLDESSTGGAGKTDETQAHPHRPSSPADSTPSRGK